MVFKVLLKSIKVSIKEWKYFLLLCVGIFLNYHIFNLKENLQISYKILAYGIAITYTLFIIASSFSLWGRVTRHTYELQPYPWLHNIKKSIYAGSIFLVFTTILGIVTHILLIYLSNIILRSLIVLIFFALIISSILEILKVFFLDKEIFSLAEIISRVISPKFWISYISLVVFITICYSLTDKIFSLIKVNITNTIILMNIYYILRSLISGYIIILTIIFFTTIFNLQEDAEV